MLRTGGLLALLCCLQAVSAYYLPGTYPQEFLVGDVIQGERGLEAGSGRIKWVAPAMDQRALAASLIARMQ